MIVCEKSRRLAKVSTSVGITLKKSVQKRDFYEKGEA